MHNLPDVVFSLVQFFLGFYEMGSRYTLPDVVFSLVQFSLLISMEWEAG